MGGTSLSEKGQSSRMPPGCPERYGSDMIRILTPKAGETVTLFNEGQRDFILGSYLSGPDERTHIDKYKLLFPGAEEGTHEDSYPSPVVFTASGCPEGAELLICEQPADGNEKGHGSTMRVPMTVGADGTASAGVYNFKIGTEYHAVVVSGAETSDAVTFVTEDLAPRLIRADGGTNIRDIGAWKTADGKRLRQGMIYRSGEMDFRVEIRPEGIAALTDGLGIRTDLDLRGEAKEKTSSPLGERVNYRKLPVWDYDRFIQGGKECGNVKEIFELFADESAYPIIFHCQGGADRAGSLAYTLESILGISEKDKFLDYDLTTLSYYWVRARTSDCWKRMLDGFAAYGAEQSRTVQCERFLYDCGVTPETIEKIRKILIIG